MIGPILFVSVVAIVCFFLGYAVYQNIFQGISVVKKCEVVGCKQEAKQLYILEPLKEILVLKNKKGKYIMFRGDVIDWKYYPSDRKCSDSVREHVHRVFNYVRNMRRAEKEGFVGKWTSEEIVGFLENLQKGYEIE